MQMKTMPESSIIPVLIYSDINEAIIWLTNTFGFQERWRIGNHRAQLSYDNGTIVVTEGTSRNSAALLIRVKNIDEHFTISKSNGAKIVSSPAPPTNWAILARTVTRAIAIN